MATKKDFSQVAHDVFMRAIGQAPVQAPEPSDFTQIAFDAVHCAIDSRPTRARPSKSSTAEKSALLPTKAAAPKKKPMR